MEPKQNHRSVERLLKTRGNIAAATDAAALRSIEYNPPHNATNEETIELLPRRNRSSTSASVVDNRLGVASLLETPVM